MILETVSSLVRWMERQNRRHSLVPTTPFLPEELFDWSRPFQENWVDIREELDNVLAFRGKLPNFQDISPEQRNLTTDDNWKTYFFHGYGFTSAGNLASCPKTAAALRGIPGLTTAFFSILGPGKRLPQHRGPYNGVLRYHLALKIPEPADESGITVGGETRHWREGGGMFFDDTYPHSAWNNTDQDRVVLFIDILRPLRFPYNLLNRLAIAAIAQSPFIKNAKENQRAWEERFSQLSSGGRAPEGQR